MEILCACDERYLPHTATMLCSVLEHNRGSRIYLFHSSIENRELEKLKSLVQKQRSAIVCYEMPEDFQGLRVDGGRSIAVYFRLAAPRVLPTNINKILYLDSDLIVRQTLAGLWNTELLDYALAAVEDIVDPGVMAIRKRLLGLPPGAKYFNSGVMLINLNYWRQNDVAERALAFVRENPEKAECWDQDALNVILVHRWIELPVTWNYQIISNPGHPAPAVVHFWGAQPWRWSGMLTYNQEYHYYRLKTPWRRYRIEGRPSLLLSLYLSLRSLARAVLPHGLRRWLKLRLRSAQM